ncbi:MAG: FAD/NAD(P)-binding protein [Archaeoglobaceae archaeon]|nr:FAD/NAD(P)-binding protein [Archaeoglobaceae archaeon]MDW7989270.1 FAD/NAD(P)-binding protein [Archaeoglobaceae archaeon]
MENIYKPFKSKILKIVEQTCDTKVFRLEVKDFKYMPGQFVELSIPGIGEAPISITSSPHEEGYIDLCVRRVGNVTNALHRMNVGDYVWIRGPYGVGFPFETIKGKDIVYVAGGIGMAPLRSSLRYVLHKKKDFGKVTLLYGARTPADLLYKEEFDIWAKECNFLVTVDSDKLPDGKPSGWKGNIGVVTTLFAKLGYSIKDAIGIVCGPPAMYKFVIQEFRKAGMPDSSIYISLERHMKCGVGKCQHCQINNRYVCIDGPVFNYADVKHLPESI